MSLLEQNDDDKIRTTDQRGHSDVLQSSPLYNMRKYIQSLKYTGWPKKVSHRQFFKKSY